MPLLRWLYWLLTAIVASVVADVSAVHAGNMLMSWAAILFFVLTLAATSIEVNRPWWSAQASHAPESAATAAIQNAHLLSLAYTWGALAMFAVYRLSGLRWQHGWQYAVGMGLIACLIALYVWRLERPRSRLRQPGALAFAAQCGLVQAFAALAGLTFLVLSGKLASTKGDWAANQIFLGGSLAVLILSAISAYTQYRLIVASESGGLAMDRDHAA
jgi:hypothetical protein